MSDHTERSEIERFYADIAADYERIFEDWHASMRWQADVLDRLLRAETGAEPGSLLDCSCGIGTQAIGLAERGYTVRGTDLSPESIERAKGEAAALGVDVTFGVADMRALEDSVPGAFDVVLSCDNSWSHLLTDDDVHAAARSMAAKLRPGGLLLVSLRDYDVLAQERLPINGPHFREDAAGKRIFLQVWDWFADGSAYTLHHYITYQQDGVWRDVRSHVTLRALRRATVTAALEAAGLVAIRWHMPDESGYYQPLVTARKV